MPKTAPEHLPAPYYDGLSDAFRGVAFATEFILVREIHDLKWRIKSCIQKYITSGDGVDVFSGKRIF